MKIPDFKMGITFSGKYRKRFVEPICNALSGLGYDRDDIFYDEWHEDLINGPSGDNVLRTIYQRHCKLVIVLLSPDYKERNWPGNIEWPSVKELINTGKSEKICLLGVDSVNIENIDGLYTHQAIPKYVDDLSPYEIAKFIIRVYERRFGAEDLRHETVNISRSDDSHHKPGWISKSMGGVVIQPEWRDYITRLVEKITYYVENYGDVTIGRDERTAVVAYYREGILIRFYMICAAGTESAEGSVIEIRDSYLSEQHNGTCVFYLVNLNDAAFIREYIPGDWDERIFSWK